MALAAFAACGLMADQLTLTDGSVLKGKITEVHAGKVSITTEFAGNLVIPREKVAQMATDAPVMVALPNEKLERKGDLKADKATVGTRTVAPDAIQSVWKLGGVDPTLPKPPPPRKWTYEANFDLTGKTGNTEKTNFGGGMKATLKGPEDKLLLYARGRYGRENGVKNEQEFFMGTDYERQFAGTGNSFYARLEVEHDKINNYDRYWTGAAGYGYYFLKTDDAQIRLRAGLSYQYKVFNDDRDDEDSVGMDFNYHHEFKIANFFGIKNLGKLVTDITYTPTYEDWANDYRIFHESSIDMPLGGSKNWTLRLGVSNEYNNQVARDADRLDTSYFARLVFSWD